jgi:hypothetical protein
MKEWNGELLYKDKTYKLYFNLNVMESIQEAFGSLEEWGKLTGKAEPDAKAVITGFTFMINEGIDIENEDNGTDIKPLTHKQVGRMITEIGLKNAQSTLEETVVESTKSTEKNA